MKIEFHLEGPHVCAWFATAVIGYNEARAKDLEAWEAKIGLPAAVGTGAATAAAEEAPVEAEKPKATRSRKKAEEPAPEQPQITASPEDRKPVEDIPEAEVVEETVDVFEDVPAPKVYTRDDVKAAMQAYVAKHGMDKLAANAPELLGAPKLSAIPEDAAAFEAAVKRLEAAVAG